MLSHRNAAGHVVLQLANHNSDDDDCVGCLQQRGCELLAGAILANNVRVARRLVCRALVSPCFVFRALGCDTCLSLAARAGALDCLGIMVLYLRVSSLV